MTDFHIFNKKNPFIIDIPIGKYPDDEYLHLKQEAFKQEKHAIDNLKKLKNISNENNYLKNIKNDYIEHYNIIKKEKEKSKIELLKLQKYIEIMKDKNKVTESVLNDILVQQKDIFKEINNIDNSIKQYNI